MNIMRSAVVATLIWFGIATGMADAFSDEDTHPRITETAVVASQLDDYLNNNLGFTTGSASIVKGTSIIQLLRAGSTKEDSPNYPPLCRASNHFHNPLFDWIYSQMSDTPWLDFVCTAYRYSNVTWATGYSWPPPPGTKVNFAPSLLNPPITWDTARQYYYEALISSSYSGREKYFAKTFESIGHVVHLLQDMAVPAHTRNDFQSHLIKNADSFLGGQFDRIQPFESYVKNNPNLVASVQASPPAFSDTYVTFFWDTNQYNGDAPLTTNTIGLAEFTNANYLSAYTIPSDNPGLEHSFPYPAISNIDYQTCVDFVPANELYPLDYRRYVSRKSKGACPQITRDRTVDHFAVYSILDDEGAETSTLTLGFDNNVHNTYAKELLPRAVGYSAGLLNYFFRGTLDVIMPDRIVYAIADGSAVPQQFTTIKAKVLNTTPNEAMGAGTLVAFAKYKKRIDYQPDLSADPPTAESREADFSYSVSAPITIASLPTMTEFTFDFAQSPIPAGITDLYLFVVFKGTLGNETDTAVAVGMEDLYEPLHITVWNSTDRFYLDNVLRTREEILNDPALLSRVDHDGDGSPDERINRYSVSTDLAFAAAPLWAEPYQVSYYSMPPGGYGRLLLLADTEFWIHARRETSDIVTHTLYNVYDGVVNAEYGGTFYGEQVYSFRGIRQHGWISYAEYYPDNTDIVSAPWPAAADPAPQPVEFIRQ